MSDDPSRKLLKFAKKGREPDPETSGENWKLIIADDDEEVHSVTRLVLKGKTLFGRKITLLSAKSGTECRELLALNPDTAVVLLDVVMENEDTGLLVAKWIREGLGNNAVRIILRTGQPGRAPASHVITEYEINDYKEKTELTNEKLWSSVVTAIRGYRDIRTIEQSKSGMEMIIQAAPSLFKLQSLRLFASGVLTQLISILNAGRDAALPDMSGFAASVASGEFRVLAGTGDFVALDERGLESALGTAGLDFVKEASLEPGIHQKDERLAICIEGLRGKRSILYMDRCRPLEGLDRNLLQLFNANVTSAYTNIVLYDELELRLSEKTALLREIHHRVKNNLQIIQSLIDMSEADSESGAIRALSDSRHRIAAMALIHDRVYASRNDELIDFSDCASDIAADFVQALPERGPRPNVSTTVEDFLLPLEKAVPCSLLIEELIAMMFAYSDENGDSIRLVLRTDEDRYHSITVSSSNRCGPACTDTLSSRLVNALAQQLGGTLRVDDENGLSIGVRFPA